MILNIGEDGVDVGTDDIEALDSGFISFDMSELDAFVFELSEKTVLVSDISSMHMMFSTSNDKFTSVAGIWGWGKDIDEGSCAWGSSSSSSAFSDISADLVRALSALNVVVDSLDVGIDDLLALLGSILSLPVGQLLAFSVELNLQLIRSFVLTEMVFSTSNDEVAGVASIWGWGEDIDEGSCAWAGSGGGSAFSDVNTDLVGALSALNVVVDSLDVGINDLLALLSSFLSLPVSQLLAFSVEMSFQLIGSLVRMEVVFSTSNDEVAGVASIWGWGQNISCFRSVGWAYTDQDISADLGRTLSSRNFTVDGSDVGINISNAILGNVSIVAVLKSKQLFSRNYLRIGELTLKATHSLSSSFFKLSWVVTLFLKCLSAAPTILSQSSHSSSPVLPPGRTSTGIAEMAREKPKIAITVRLCISEKEEK